MYLITLAAAFSVLEEGGSAGGDHRLERPLADGALITACATCISFAIELAMMSNVNVHTPCTSIPATEVYMYSVCARLTVAAGAVRAPVPRRATGGPARDGAYKK